MGVCHTYGTVGEDGTHFAEIITPSCDARRYRFALQRPADSPTGPRAASLASNSLPRRLEVQRRSHRRHADPRPATLRDDVQFRTAALDQPRPLRGHWKLQIAQALGAISEEADEHEPVLFSFDVITC